MNRGQGATEEAGMVRLDPERPAPSQQQPEPPPEPPPVDEDSTLDEVAKKLTGEDARAEQQKIEDQEFLEDYKDLDLMRLVTEGFVTHEAEIFKDFRVELRTLTEDEDQEVLKYMQDLTGSNWYVSDMSARYTLSIAMIKVNSVEFGKDRGERHEKIGKWGKPIKLAILKEFRQLCKAVALKMEGHSGNWLERLLIGQDWI